MTSEQTTGKSTDGDGGRIKHLSHVSQRVEREPYVIPPRTDRIEVLSWVSRRAADRDTDGGAR